MNSNDQPKQNKWLTKRLLKIIAFLSLVVGAAVLVLCVKFYVEDAFLQAGATINPNPKVIEGMTGMIRAGYFGIIPAMSAMLFINSLLLWACSLKFYSKSDK